MCAKADSWLRITWFYPKMQLRINHRGNELLSMVIESSSKVLQVKLAITKSLGIPTKEQILTARGIYLEDSRSLQDYGITESTSLDLHLSLNCQQITSIRVIMSPVDVYSIPIRSNATVADLRVEIAKRSKDKNFDISSAYLIYSHWVLEDSRKLEDYEMKENACVIVAKTMDPDKPIHTEPYDYCDEFQESEAPPQQRMIGVHFLTESGEPFTMMLDPEKPLKTICQSVEITTGIPIDNQNFIMSGRMVDANLSPNKLGIADGESLYLSNTQAREIIPTRKKYPPQRNEMSVILDMGRQHVRLIVPVHCTVEDIQRALLSHHLIKSQRVDLYFKEKLLEPRRQLTDYGIVSESVIQVGTPFL